MPILPIIDLLILMGWTSMLVGGVIKAVHITTHYNPTFLGLGPMDLLLIGGMLLLLALTLAARTWVKLYEPELMGRRLASNRDRGEVANGFRGNGGMSDSRSLDLDAGPEFDAGSGFDAGREARD